MSIEEERQEYEAASRALHDRDVTTPIPRDALHRFLRARAVVNRERNLGEHYEQWIEQVEQALGRDRESIRLLSFEETWHLLENGRHVTELIKQQAIASIHQYGDC